MVISLLYILVLVTKQGVAAWYYCQYTLEGFDKAMQWDAKNPQFYVASARFLQFARDHANPVHRYELATFLSPQRAQYGAELGVALEWAGQIEAACRAVEHAQELFLNSPDIHWTLGNLYIRAGTTS